MWCRICVCVCFLLSVQCELSDSRFQVRPAQFGQPWDAWPSRRQQRHNWFETPNRIAPESQMSQMSQLVCLFQTPFLWLRRECSQLAGACTAMHSYAIDAASSYSVQERNLKSHLNPLVCNSLPRWKAGACCNQDSPFLWLLDRLKFPSFIPTQTFEPFAVIKLQTAPSQGCMLQ